MKREIEKLFAQRVNAIYHELCGAWDKDEHYFDDCSVYAGKFEIIGRHLDFVKSFDHEPTDREIKNALVYRFNLNLKYLK